MAIRLVTETPAVRIGAVGPLLVSVWFEEANVEAMQLVMKHQRRLAAEHGGQATILGVAMTLPARPAPEATSWLRESGLVNDSSIRATVICILARGLGAVFARSFIAAISLFSRKRFFVVKNLADAAAAVRDVPGQDPRLASLEALGEELHEFVEQRRPVVRVG
jgi:hypothetical protein